MTPPHEAMTPDHAPPSSTGTLSDLLLRWRDLREKGEECSAEELCRERPELVEPLRENIAAVEAMERVLSPDGKNTVALNGPIALPSAVAVPGYELLGEL